MVHKLAEEGRVAVRHARTDVLHEDQEARAHLRGRQDAGREGRAEAPRRAHPPDRRADQGERSGDHGSLTWPGRLLDRVRESGPVPAHVAIIMDGNGRWARQRSLPRPFGHQAGMAAVREAVEGALAAGVEVLTLFAFSQENWQRPAGEIAALMALLEEYIAREMAELREQGVSVTLPRRPRPARAERARGGGAHHGGHPAAATGSRSTSASRTARAPRSRAPRGTSPRTCAPGGSPPRTSTRTPSRRSSTPRAWPDPDLLIRTSGEQRLSNFLLWQLAYAELFVSPVLWPDFTREHAVRGHPRLPAARAAVRQGVGLTALRLHG